MESINLLSAVALAVTKVVLVCAGGAWLGRRGILDETGTRRLSQVIFQLLLPCLLFSKISASIDPQQLKVLWMLPVISLIYIGIGFGLGRLGRTLLKPPEDLRRVITAAAAFGNSGYLPMTLIVAMATTVPALQAIPGAADRGIALISIYLVGFTGPLWGIGYPYLAGKGADIPWRKMISPPLVACIAGLLVGITPPVRELLHGDDPTLGVLSTSMEMLGMAAIPCAMLVLGGNLARGPQASAAPVRVVLGVGILRLLLMPLIGMGITLGLLRLGLLPRDPLLLLVLMIEAATPCANNLVVIAGIHGKGEKAFATILFWVYLASVVTLTLYGSLFIHTVFAV